MPIRVYNSLTKRKEEFIPQDGHRVKMYVCGITAYDRSHIGHGRSLYIFDVIRRYLKYRGYDVHFVRNITDIDDKIIEKAKELNQSPNEVARENIAFYYEDLARLGLDKADSEPRATENIPEMIRYISGLIERGFAYVVEGDVYFSIRKLKDYGKLSGQSIEEMREAVRIEKDPKKKDPLDFSLWKKSKEGEPSWESPWGKGRPGWHIECSTMSVKYLKSETLDIHAGGRDLIFPHHENEIAQSEALTGKPLARYWLHHGLLTINGHKMAKSLGNFITIEEATKRYDTNDLKMFYLSSHYLSPIDFTEEKMIEAHKAVERLDILFWKAYDILKDKDAAFESAPFIEENKQHFLEAMDDDFNTPKALGYLFELLNATNRFIQESQNDPDYFHVVYSAVDTVEDLVKNIFGLFTGEVEKELPTEFEELLLERQRARAKKDFKKSDEIRKLLRQKGIAVEDTKDGQTWRWL